MQDYECLTNNSTVQHIGELNQKRLATLNALKDMDAFQNVELFDTLLNVLIKYHDAYKKALKQLDDENKA